MPLLAGRDFRFQEPDGWRGAIINETMAHYCFDDDDPIGRHFTFDGDAKPYEIVGVVGDAEYSDWREEIPRTVYLNSFASGATLGARHLVIRTSVEPLTAAPEARRAVRELMESMPIKQITTLRGQFEETLVPERLTAQLAGLFGALGAVLAAIGLFGLLAYTVARRSNEIGLRMALGATPGDATRIVLRDALGMVCAGLAIGALAAFWSKRLAATVFDGLPLDNPLPILFAGAAMVAIALVASYVPARQAAGVDPMEALRHD
jgi:FtsX-like permease family protein